MKHVILLLSLCVLVAALSGCSESTTSSNSTSQAPTSTPDVQSANYPPTTVADLRGLAAKGDANAIHEFHSESVGAAGVCPQPKREVTVAPSLTGQQLAEDLLAYFYGQQLDNSCGSVVFAYHDKGEAGNEYTAGRVLLGVTDSNGGINFNPNASNLKHKLTLDTGEAYKSQESIVTY